MSGVFLSGLLFDEEFPYPCPSPFSSCTPPFTFADHTASTQPSAPIESYIQSTLSPYYANTHTTASHSGGISTSLRSEARRIISDSINASYGSAGENKAKETDAVLFVGAGATAAINFTATNVLPFLDSSSSGIFVFTSSYEHHSNLLPFRQSPHVRSIITVPGVPLNTNKLHELLTRPEFNLPNTRKIVSVSMASNITGHMTDLPAISKSILETDPAALLFVDAATAIPYLPLDFTGLKVSALFLSGHKIPGGGERGGSGGASLWLDSSDEVREIAADGFIHY